MTSELLHRFYSVTEPTRHFGSLFACLLGPHQNREFILSGFFPHASLNDNTNSEVMRMKQRFLSSSLNMKAVDMLRLAHLPLPNLHTTCWERKAVVGDTEHHLRIWICQDKVPISAVMLSAAALLKEFCLMLLCLFFFLKPLTNLIKGNGETIRVNTPLMLFKLNHASNIKKKVFVCCKMYTYMKEETYIIKQ